MKTETGRKLQASTVRGNRFGWLMALPYVILLGLFAIGPLGYVLYESFQPSDSPQPGGNAFADAFGDFRFLPAVENVATFIAIYLPLMVVGVVFLALLLDVQPRRFGAAIRLVYILPGVIVGAASVLLWYAMLQPDLSPFGPALRAAGWTSTSDVFQNSHMTFLYASMAFATGFGQWVVILFGSLQSISADILEAATIDGASGWRLALAVKLPMVRRYIVYMLILAFAGALQIFIEPALFQQIASVGSDTWSLNQLSLYFAFDNGDFASSAVVSLSLLLVCLGFAGLAITKTGMFATDVPE